MRHEWYWGKHYLVDCVGCNKELMQDADNLRKFLKVLIHRIDMKAYGEPMMARFALHDPDKGGYTICQMIETSLIDGHFVDERGEAYISIHSCKSFDTDTVDKTIQEFFRPTHIKTHLVYRHASVPWYLSLKHFLQKLIGGQTSD